MLQSACVLGLIRTLITLVILAVLVYCGATVKLGERTFFGHVSRIWSSEETRDLVDGVKETSEPVVDKVKRGVKAGYDEATREDKAGGEHRRKDKPDAGR